MSRLMTQGKPGHAQSDGGDDNRVAAKPKELVGLAGIMSSVVPATVADLERITLRMRAARPA
jgi:hypothetical protein